MRRTFADEKWRREWFAPCVANLTACRFKRFTDNFIQVGANPGNVDFFDDAGWKNIVEHWRIAAWAAKQSGFKGLLFDPEPYTRPFAQFRYAAQPQRGKHSFEQYAARARRRGREVMQAVAKEYPDLTILCYFMNIVCSRAAAHPDPKAALSTETYGLYPAFIDGWLDAAGPGVKFVDGCEWGYRFNSVEEFLEAAVAIKGACQRLVSPTNRAKYRSQVQAGFGLYLDAYWNPKDSKWSAWYIDGKGGPRVERLRINTATALRVSDEYVWFWGEKFRWWPTPNASVGAKGWPEALPGCEKALRYARDPDAYGRAEIERLRAAGRLTNLARNGDFGSVKVADEGRRDIEWKPGRPPAGWGAWQEAGSKGTFTWDREAGSAGKGSARAAGVRNGCFVQSHAVKGGRRYAVRALRKRTGAGRAWVRIRWKDAEGKWTAEARDRLIYAAGSAGIWREVFGVVEVPESAGVLVILLGVAGQSGEGDVVRFDDVELCRIE